MDSKGPNFTVAETHALLWGVKCYYVSIVGSSVGSGMVTNKRKKTLGLKSPRMLMQWSLARR